MEVSEGEIKKTKEYGMFKLVAENREINKRHLKRLVKSISEENRLSMCPIIVNKHLEVIAGQHRLEAAKFLQLPIYYKVHPTATIRDAQILSSAVSAWSQEDALHHYNKMAIEPYMDLHKLVSENPVMSSVILKITIDENSRDIFFNGRLKPIDKPRIIYIIQVLQEVTNKMRDLNFRVYKMDEMFLSGIIKRLYLEGEPISKLIKNVEMVSYEMISYRDSSSVYKAFKGENV